MRADELWGSVGRDWWYDEDTRQRPESSVASSSLIGVALFMAGMFVWGLGQFVGDGNGVVSWAMYLSGGALAVNGFVWMCRLWFGSRAWFFAIPLIAGLFVIGQDLTSDLSYALMVHMAVAVLTVSGLLRNRQIAA